MSFIGGKPGWGNQRYQSLPVQYQPPRFNDLPHNKGQHGETRRYVLTLKCIADVGLIGYPNAGMSIRSDGYIRYLANAIYYYMCIYNYLHLCIKASRHC